MIRKSPTSLLGIAFHLVMNKSFGFEKVKMNEVIPKQQLILQLENQEEFQSEYLLASIEKRVEREKMDCEYLLWLFHS